MARSIFRSYVVLFIIASYAMISCDDSDFQDVAQEWANNVAKYYKTSVKFVDLKAEQSDMQPYKWAHTEYNYLSTRLENPGKLPQTGQADTFEQTFINRGSVDSTTVFTKEVETENTFSLQITESFKYGMSAEASLSFLGSGFKITESFEFNLSSNQETTKKETKKWKIEQTIKIPARKSVVLKFILQTDFYQDFWIESEIELKGWVGVSFKNAIDLNHDVSHQSDLHHLWFVPVQTIVHQVSKKNYRFNAQGNPVFVARGRIGGNNGLKSWVTLEEHNIGDIENDIKFLE